MWEQHRHLCILSSKRNIFALLEWKIGHVGLLTAHIKFFRCRYQMQDFHEKNATLSDISKYSKCPDPASMNVLLFCWKSTKRSIAHILLNSLYRIFYFKGTQSFIKHFSHTSSVLGLILHCLSTIALQSPPTVHLNIHRVSIKPQADFHFPDWKHYCSFAVCLWPLSEVILPALPAKKGSYEGSLIYSKQNQSGLT